MARTGPLWRARLRLLAGGFLVAVVACAPIPEASESEPEAGEEADAEHSRPAAAAADSRNPPQPAEAADSAGALDTENDVTASPGAATASASGSSRSRPDVFLIVIDTLRLDALGAYADRERDTPFLDRLARRGVVFDNAYATSSWTVPSMYSLITGLYPREHQVEMGNISRQGVMGQPALSPQAATLPEALHDAGYATFGVCTNHHLHRKYGFAQGFDQFVGSGFLKLPFPEIAVDTIAGGIERRAPAFVWLHYFDPHFPYRANAPWFSARNDSGFRDWDALSVDAMMRLYRKARGLPEGAPPVPGDLVRVHRKARTLVAAHPKELLRAARIGGEDVVRRYVRFLRAAYGSEVAAVDRSLEEVFGEIGIDDDDLVIVVSDHGEEFLEHGGIGHRWLRSLHEELVHVPLIVLLPGRRHAGKRVTTPVSLVDLMPTVLEAVGLDPGEGEHSGRSLMPLIESGRAGFDRVLYAELREPSGDVRSLIDHPWKYTRDFARKREALFDLERDPGEQRDLSLSQPQRLRQMRTRLERWMERTGPRWSEAAPVPLTADELARLRAMGYVL